MAPSAPPDPLLMHFMIPLRPRVINHLIQPYGIIKLLIDALVQYYKVLVDRKTEEFQDEISPDTKK